MLNIRSITDCANGEMMNSANSVGVIGLGHVGQSVVNLISPHRPLAVWDIASSDPFPAREFEQCEFCIIAVNTPTGEDGHADLRNVEDAIRRAPCKYILLKSTVAPGTADRLELSEGKNICYWPEYTGESKYYNPYFNTGIDEVPFVILGAKPATRSWFIDRLLPILGPTKRYFQCGALEAELIKYAENAYFATKITFVNEFRRLSESFGADWHTVREGWMLDPRVEPMHTAAFQSQPGFNGKCLPKDLQAIITAAIEIGYSPDFLAEVLRSNNRFRQDT